MSAATPSHDLGSQPESEVRRALAAEGLWLDVGLTVVRVRSTVPHMAAQLQAVYRHFPWCPAASWADIHAELEPVRPWRAGWKPHVRFWCDGQSPYEPFPRDQALPLLEWGVNYQLARRMNSHVLLHAGVLERNGYGLVMPALPGSGKSTLTAALSLRGWRLLSDEFGAYDLRTDRLQPVIKPVGLKNASIDVIRGFDPGAELGPSFANTRKGTVAHLAPSSRAVALRHVTVPPAAIVLPRWLEGQPTQLETLTPQLAFSSLAFNAFNYMIAGADGFRAMSAIADRMPVVQLTYSQLDDAIATLDRFWTEVVAARSEGTQP